MTIELKSYRVNEQIRRSPVRVIGVEGKNLGIMPLQQALALAREADLDLVEVGPNENPPVCRILDYGKFKYEQQKKQRSQAHHTKIKEIHLRPGTGKHDLEVKINRAKEFLEDRDKVLVVVEFKGREAAHIEEGMRVIQTVIGALAEIGRVENPPRNEGRQRIVCLIGPRLEDKRPKEKDKPAEKPKAAPAPQPVPEQKSEEPPAPVASAPMPQQEVSLADSS